MKALIASLAALGIVASPALATTKTTTTTKASTAQGKAHAKLHAKKTIKSASAGKKAAATKKPA